MNEQRSDINILVNGDVTLVAQKAMTLFHSQERLLLP